DQRLAQTLRAAIQYSVSQTPQVLLDHVVFDLGGELTVIWDAVDAAFPEHMLDNMFTVYSRILRALAEDITDLRSLDLLPPEHQARRAEGADTAHTRHDRLLHATIDSRCKSQPDATAIATASRTVTYGELDRWADNIATTVQTLGVQPNT